MKTKKEILLETKEYYENNDRAVSVNNESAPGGCCYYMETVDKVLMCAVGRCFLDEVISFQKEHLTKHKNFSCCEDSLNCTSVAGT